MTQAQDQIDDVTPSEDSDARAAEYVLGLLTDAETQRFETALNHDADMRQDVAAWAEYFSTFTDAIPEHAPPDPLLRRIEAAAFGETERRSVLRQLLPYVVGAVAGTVLTWLVFTSGLLTQAAPQLRADLRPTPDAELAFAARFDPQSRVLIVDHLAGPVPENRVLHLWLTPDAQSTPVSLGMLSAPASSVLVVPPRLADAMALAILTVSQEPVGGVVGEAPTGPIQSRGTVSVQ